MNISVDKKPANVIELSIVIEPDDYVSIVETTLKKQRQNAQIAGFRKGLAPIGLIKKMYEQPILEDEIRKLMSDKLFNYIKEEKIEYICEPMPIEGKFANHFDMGDTFSFSFEIAEHPEFKLELAKMPQVDLSIIQASEEEIRDYIKQLQQRHGKYINPEEVGAEDYITGNLFEAGSDHQEEVPKFVSFLMTELTEKGRQKLIGKKKDEEISLQLKEDMTSDKAGAKLLSIDEKEYAQLKSYDYKIKIDSIGRVELAELNEDFYKKAFPDGNIKDETALKAFAVEEIEKVWKQETDKKFMNDAIETIIDKTEMILPEDFLKRYLLAVQKDITPEKIDAEFEDYRKVIKWQMIENDIIKNNDIKVLPEDIKAYIRQFFVNNYFQGVENDDNKTQIDGLVDNAMKQQKDVKQIYDNLLDIKLKDVLLAQVPTKEQKMDYKKFIELMTPKA